MYHVLRLRPSPRGPRLNALSDRHLLYVAAFTRALATGMIGVLLGVYLAELGRSPRTIGLVVSLGLAGAAAGTLLVTLRGDLFGNRTTLLLATVLAVAGGAALAVSDHPVVLALAAFFGMVNGMGRDRGAALVVEQAALPATVSDAERTMAFARYNVLQDVGHAAGGLLAGLPSVLGNLGADHWLAFRGSVGVYAALSLVPLAAYLRLSPAIEQARVVRGAKLSESSRRVLWKISSLFAVDAVAGGFLTTALLSFFFHARFSVGVGMIGALFAAARMANAFSHLGAAWLARRIGLVNTMVFTHIPSSLLLVTVAYAPSFPVAAALFLLRESLVEMDVPTRQSYVMAIVRPEERRFASGVTHLVRLASWAVAPAFAGLMMQGASLVVPLVVGAGLKIVYDVMLWRAFRHVRPPEEEAP